MNWRHDVRADAAAPLDDEFGSGRGHCVDCGADWNGQRICHCPTCHLTFTAVGGFDFHRIGRDDSRRCRNPAELRDAGYEPNPDNQWRKPAPEDAWKDRNG
jgi:hypothetical protein